MSLAQALERFHLGEITQQELYWEVDRVLTEWPEDLPDLIAQMERTVGALQIAPQIIDPIRSRIAANTGTPVNRPEDNRTRLRTSPTTAPTLVDTSASLGPGFQTGFSGNHVLSDGDILGNRFRLEKLLGTGGMSQVFLAEDLHAYGNPRVALKVLSKAFSAHPDAVISLKRETSKAQLLAHPNIVNVRDFGIDGPYTYMWMEYLEAGSLTDEIKNTRGRGLPPADAMMILEGICAALDYAHDHNIVHADLKPGNCMLTHKTTGRGAQIKIIDFGIARPERALKDDGERTLYDPGKLEALTLAYASPQMQAGEDLDRRDDMYALGCIAYEVFTGKHPFERITSTQAMARRLEIEKHESLSKQQLSAIRHAMSFEREKRTASAGEFLREFQGEVKTRRVVP